MGWWRTDEGDVLGDGPLNILEAFRESATWREAQDLPADVRAVLDAEYLGGMGRLPTTSEITSLLKLNAGDTSLGVPAQILKLRDPEPP